MAVHEDQGLLQSHLVLSPQNWSVPHVQYLVIRVHRIQHLHDTMDVRQGCLLLILFGSQNMYATVRLFDQRPKVLHPISDRRATQKPTSNPQDDKPYVSCVLFLVQHDMWECRNRDS